MRSLTLRVLAPLVIGATFLSCSANSESGRGSSPEATVPPPAYTLVIRIDEYFGGGVLVTEAAGARTVRTCFGTLDRWSIASIGIGSHDAMCTLSHIPSETAFTAV